MKPWGLPVLAVMVVVAGAGHAAAQQWPVAELALRTNGGIVRPGECLRLTLVATDDIPGPLTPSVTYRYTTTVTIEHRDGTRTEQRRQEVRRDPGPVLDRLDAGTSIVLDDSLCFGDASDPGPYEIEVALTSFGTSSGRLWSCVAFQPHADTPVDGCGFALRGIRRGDTTEAVMLDADVAGGGLYRLLAYRGDRLVAILDDDVAATGPRELTVAGSALRELGSAPLDLVLHDQVRHRSASTTRLVLPR
jgi:hypothetical protein